MTNCISTRRDRQQEVLQDEASDITLAGLRAQAAARGIWLLIGSLAVKTDDADGRFANRQFLIGPDGDIRARYDKIHMFDVQIGEGETYRESAGYRPGTRAVVADMPGFRLGMATCYDMRFGHLSRALVQAGAQVLVYPSAFSPVTGPRIGTACCGRVQSKAGRGFWPRPRPARTPRRRVHSAALMAIPCG